MSHSNTAKLLDYWRTRRPEHGAPPRASIDPADFPELASQALVIGRAAGGVFPLRLAGALLDDLHAVRLAGHDFLALWAPSDRPRLRQALDCALARAEAVILRAQGRTFGGAQAALEILLAPLSGKGGEADRLFGLYQPVSPLFRLQGQRIERLFLLEAAMADGGEPAAWPVRLAAVEGRLIA